MSSREQYGSRARETRRHGAFSACCEWLPELTLAAVTAFSCLVCLQLSRRLWFFGDDWDFLLERRASSFSDVMTPHNEHWSALPILVFRAVFSAVGLGSYLPYALLPLVSHALVVLLAYVLGRRLGASRWSMVICLVPLVFLGAGAEDLLWDFQIGFVLPLALGIGALVVYAGGSSRPGVWRTVASSVLTILAMTCSGIGIPVLVLVAVFIFLDRGIRRMALVVGPPVVIYGLWYLTYGATGAAADSPEISTDFVKGILYSIVAPWTAVGVVPSVGPVLALVVVVTPVAVRAASQRLQALAVSGLIAWGAFILLIVSSRLALTGPELVGTASRYVYPSIVLCSWSLAILVQRTMGQNARTPSSALLVGGLAVLVGVSGISQLVEFAHERQGAQARMQPGIVVAGLDLVNSNTPLLSARIDPVFSPNADIRLLRDAGAATDLRDVTPSGNDRLQASSTLQVSVTSQRADVPVAQSVGVSRSFEVEQRRRGCTRYQGPPGGRLTLYPGAAGTAVKLVPRSTSITTKLGGKSSSRGWAHDVVPGKPVWVNTTATGSRLVVIVPGSRIQVCTSR